jgi:hypothetical protein
MSADEKDAGFYVPRTKREALLMRRAYCMDSSGRLWTDDSRAAASLYPIPTRTVTRPREVMIGPTLYRVRDGRIQFEASSGRWELSGYTVAGTAALAALIADPTETVTVEVDE